MDGLKKQL